MYGIMVRLISVGIYTNANSQLKKMILTVIVLSLLP